MALTSEESSALMNDFTFRGRVKASCVKYANAKLIVSSTALGFASGYRWATTCLDQPDQMAATVTPGTVMDPAVQEAGAAITDAALQGAVEGTVNKRI